MAQFRCAQCFGRRGICGKLPVLKQNQELMQVDKMESLNVLGTELEECGVKPVTGFFRDGSCNTSKQDVGSHTVCAVMTREFLDYSREQGNDLSTPMPEYGFPGLKPGDTWCLCARRWLEALEAGKAPRVRIRATHQACLQVLSLDDLKQYANDLS